MCLNLNCNRKVFENGVQSESVMGVNVWKGSDSVQMKLSTIFCMYIGWINKCCIYSRCQLSQYIYKYRQPCCLTQCEWGFAHVLYCANIASDWHRSSSRKWDLSQKCKNPFVVVVWKSYKMSLRMGNILFSLWMWKSFVNNVPKLPSCFNFVFVFVYLELLPQ